MMAKGESSSFEGLSSIKAKGMSSAKMRRVELSVSERTREGERQVERLKNGIDIMSIFQKWNGLSEPKAFSRQKAKGKSSLVEKAIDEDSHGATIAPSPLRGEGWGEG